MKIIFCFALSLMFFIEIFGQSNSDFSGSWTINIERTKYPINVLTKNIRQSENEIEIFNDPGVIETITQKKALGTVYKLNGDEVSKEIETAAGKISISYSAKFVAGKLKISRKQKNAQNQDVSSSIT